MNENEEKIGDVKHIELEQKSVQEATEGMEVAISISNINYERELKDKRFLYTNISESQFKEFKKNKDLLSGSEMNVLKEISDIKRKTNSEWGM